jgi:ABC-type phosphate transport system substrate-binding protein
MNRSLRKSPRRAVAILAVIAMGASWALRSTAGPPVLLVIVNAGNPAGRLGATELRPIFQTNRKTWATGTRVDPVNLPEKSQARRDFDKAVLGFDAEESLRYWIDRRVRGDARPPKKLQTPSAVSAFVASTPGSIGYVPEGPLERGVKVVARVVDGQVKAP